MVWRWTEAIIAAAQRHVPFPTPSACIVRTVLCPLP
jgi:hypothetical protein